MYIKISTFAFLAGSTYATIIAASPACASSIVTFSSPAVDSVPEGQAPGTGGLLVSTNQNFQENGVHVEAWWSRAIPGGYYTGANNGHFHTVGPPGLFGYETSHGFDRDEDGFADKMGLYVQLVDGSSFDLVSLDWELNSALTATNVQISTTFDPTQFDPNTGWNDQFVSFPVTQVSGFSTLNFPAVPGLTQSITQLFLTADLGLFSTSRCDLCTNQIRWDNIVLESAPEPSSVVILSILISMEVIGARRLRVMRTEQ